MSLYDLMLDLKIKVGRCVLYFMVYLEDYLMYKHKNFGIMNQYDLVPDLKIKVGHCDLYFMVQ